MINKKAFLQSYPGIIPGVAGLTIGGLLGGPSLALPAALMAAGVGQGMLGEGGRYNPQQIMKRLVSESKNLDPGQRLSEFSKQLAEYFPWAPEEAIKGQASNLLLQSLTQTYDKGSKEFQQYPWGSIDLTKLNLGDATQKKIHDAFINQAMKDEYSGALLGLESHRARLHPDAASSDWMPEWLGNKLWAANPRNWLDQRFHENRTRYFPQGLPSKDEWGKTITELRKLEGVAPDKLIEGLRRIPTIGPELLKDMQSVVNPSQMRIVPPNAKNLMQGQLTAYNLERLKKFYPTTWSGIAEDLSGPATNINMGAWGLSKFLGRLVPRAIKPLGGGKAWALMQFGQTVGKPLLYDNPTAREWAKQHPAMQTWRGG